MQVYIVTKLVLLTVGLAVPGDLEAKPEED